MKKLFISGLFALALISSAFASTTDLNNFKAKQHFSGSFSDVTTVSWKTVGNLEKATFTLNNEEVHAFYNAYGELQGTSKVMAFDKLPKSALATLTTKYTFPAYQLKECIEFTSADNEKNYYVSFDTQREQIMLEITTGGSVSVLSKVSK